jgi:hypothetical protein
MNRPGRWECVRRHRTTPPLLAGTLCLPCASVSLRATPAASEPPRLALAARIAALDAPSIAAAAVRDPPSALDLLDALCGAVREAADARDPALVDGLAAALNHLASACDRDRAGSGRFCAALLSHIFAALRDAGGDGNSGLSRPLAAYVRLVACMLESEYKSLPPDHHQRQGSDSTSFFYAFQDAAVGSGDLCAVPLCALLTSEQDVPPSARFLIALFETGIADITAFVSAHVKKIFEALRAATSDSIREALLGLSSVVIKFIASDKGDATFLGSPSNQVHHHRHQSGAPGLVLAEALKSCSLSPCPRVRALVADIVAILCESASVSDMFTDILAAGFMDYLFEALRHPPQEIVHADSRPSLSLAQLSIPILNSIASIAVKHPDNLLQKWSYGLPILLRVASDQRDNATLHAVFTVILAAFKATTIPILDSAVTSQLLTLVLHAGSKLNIAFGCSLPTLGGDAMLNTSMAADDSISGMCSTSLLNDLQETFKCGIAVLEQLSQRYRFPPSTQMQLADCVECAGLLIPLASRAARLACQLVNQYVENPAAEKTQELGERIKFVVLGVWGSVAVEAFALPKQMSGIDATETSRSSLADLLHVVACAIDVQLFKKGPTEDLSCAVDWFWQHLPPKIIFLRLDTDEFEPESSDLWSSIDAQNEQLHERSVAGPKMETSSAANIQLSIASVVRLYLARICCCNRAGESDDISAAENNLNVMNPRSASAAMPPSMALFVDQVTKSADPDLLEAALMLLQHCLFHEIDSLMDRSDVVGLLIERADSALIIKENFTNCALLLSRVLFMSCQDNPILIRQVALRKDFCSVVLVNEKLNFDNAWDQEILLHILSKSHDTELRIRTWDLYSKKRRSSDKDWSQLDVRLSDLLGSDTGAAKCLVSALYEGSLHVLEMAHDMCTISPAPVSSILNQVGLLAMVICVLELKPIASASISADPHLAWHSRAARLIDIVTIGIPYASIDSLHRMLMLLVDLFVQPQVIADEQSQSQSHPHSLTLSTTCQQPSSQEIELATSILRCLASVLNRTEYFGESSFISATPPIFDYIIQSSFISRASAVLFYQFDTSILSELGEFGAGAAATLFDYMLRHEFRRRLAKDHISKSLEHICGALLRTEEAWMKLVAFHDDSNLEADLHSSVCRRTACIQLLVTWTTLSIGHELPLALDFNSSLGQFLIVHVISAAASSQLLPSSAALNLLHIHMMHEYKTKRIEDDRHVGMASHAALVMMLLHKISVDPCSAREPELRFLATALATQHMSRLDGARLITCLAYIAKSNDCDAKVPMIAEMYRQLSTALGVKGKEMLFELQEAVLVTCALEEDGDGELWACDELLLGRQAIVAAPLRMGCVPVDRTESC